jgi:hypothetical protein
MVCNVAHATPDDQKVDAYLRKIFAAEIKCAAGSTDANRAWCPVTRTGTEKLTLPAAKTLLLGFSTSILGGDSVLRQLGKSTDLAVLCLGPEPGDAKLVRLLEPSDERTQQFAPIKAALTKSLQGAAGPIDVESKLYDELQTRFCADYHKHSGEETAVETAALYRVGSAYVVIDETSSTRTQVAVIAAAPLRRK